VGLILFDGLIRRVGLPQVLSHMHFVGFMTVLVEIVFEL